jgi:predicted pyridoxine 5'-phosphate oxidase superfamily flavin-nucleotide-binding protein
MNDTADGEPEMIPCHGTTTPASDIPFTPAVKAIQERRGSRAIYHRMEKTRGWRTTVTPDLATFLAERDSVYLATANAAGQPYVQHRGGPKGFIRVLDDRTLAFADYVGNRSTSRPATWPRIIKPFCS